MRDLGSSQARVTPFLRGAEIAAAVDDLLEEFKRTKLFSERQFQVLRHPPSVFAAPTNWKELAELVGELGKPTLLGYLSEREARELKKKKVRVKLVESPAYVIVRPEEGGPERLFAITLADVRFKYLDTRSENQVIADEVEDKLAGKQKPWQIAGPAFRWEDYRSQTQWFIDSSAVDYGSAAVEVTPLDVFALAPGSTPDRPLKSFKEFRDKTDAEEIASFAEGESHERPG